MRRETRVLLSLLAMVLVAGCTATGPAPVTLDPSGSASASARDAKRSDPAATIEWADIERARSQVRALPVKGRAPLTNYDRDAFGAAWEDVNDNGCDTRNDILRRDLVDKRVEDCVVLSGVLIDPYSGDRVPFTRGPVTSLDVQIDHVVALANAWQTGADKWSATKREAFANDRRNLLAVRGDLNMRKSDGDAATWLPPRKAFRCTYVALQVQTKARYGLWVTAAEKAAMERILAAC